MDIESLKRIRGPVRRGATDSMKAIEMEINKGDEKSVDVIEELLAKLTDKEITLDKLDNDIKNLSKLDDLEKEIEKQQEYKDNIITWKIRANKILKTKQQEIHIADSVRSEQNNRNERNQCIVKLPRLQIPQYDGNILKFNDFFSQYEVAIHKNSNLSNVEKFNYLKSYLTSEAEVAIRGLALNSENYEIAINILKERFGRKNMVVDAHMSRLLNLNPVRKSYDIVSLRRLYSECETHIRGLENNGINPDNYSCIMYPILLRAIPRDLSLEFTRRTHSKTENAITDLLEFLKTEIQCRERNEHLIKEFNASDFDLHNGSKFKYENSPHERKYEKYNNRKFEHKQKGQFDNQIPKASAFVVDVTKCIFCIKPESDEHESSACPKTVEERKAFLRKNGMCYFCLGRGHLFKDCFKRGTKLCKLCGSKHHFLICNKLNLDSQPADVNTECKLATPQTVLTSKVIANNSGAENEEVLLETCTGILKGDSQNKKINILLDNASQRCFLKREVAIELKLPLIRQENLLVYTFGSTEPLERTYDVVKFEVCNIYDPAKRICIEALLSDVITSSTCTVPSHKLRKALENKHLQHCISNVTESGEEIKLLIGAQYFWQIHTGEKEKISKSLYIVDSIFGKILQGRISSSVSNCGRDVSVLKIECCTRLNEEIKNLWQLDSIGINEPCQEMTQCDQEYISRFESNLEFKNGMYETKLFWDEKPINLADNFQIAKRRFDNLCTKLNDNWVFQEYQNIVRDQLKLDIVEECSSKFEPNSFYMPHSAVVRADKETTPVRVVFDASSKGKGCKSLNDCLYSGPSLNPRIFDMILQFREFEYAFCSDIQGAFLTIGIAEEDRNYLRFFWFPDKNNSDSYKILRMTRVCFGVTNSPFILAATIKYHIRKYKDEKPEAFEMLNSSLYYDDLVYGGKTVNEALEFSQTATEILREANMNLRKFRTNSDELRNMWRDKGMIDEGVPNKNPLKVLGLIWNSEEDTLKLDVQPLLHMIDNLNYSKRCVLQTAAKIYDPVGFVSPFVVIIKCLLQEIWEHGLGWDDELPTEMKRKWEIWCSQISLLDKFTIDRKYFFYSSVNEFEIHIFADASPRAFGCVAYFRYVTQDGTFHTSFITSKSRIAPLKRLTLPRLELLAAVIAARTCKYLKTTIKFAPARTYLWSDSQVTLHWIKGKASKWKPFVSNRVTEIQSNTDPIEWHHCRGKDNPADYISRGATIEKIMSSPLWLHGPEWLSRSEDEWPKASNSDFSSDVSCERRLRDEVSTFVCDTFANITEFIDITTYSSLTKLFRVTSWVRRFIHNCRKISNKPENLLRKKLLLPKLFGLELCKKKFSMKNCLF